MASIGRDKKDRFSLKSASHMAASRPGTLAATAPQSFVAAAAPPVLAEAAEAPAPACTQEHESDGTEKAPSRRSLVLKGHRGPVYALAALDGDRLASGGGSEEIGELIIWNLADSTQLAKLELLPVNHAFTRQSGPPARLPAVSRRTLGPPSRA